MARDYNQAELLDQANQLMLESDGREIPTLITQFLRLNSQNEKAYIDAAMVLIGAELFSDTLQVVDSFQRTFNKKMPAIGMTYDRLTEAAQQQKVAAEVGSAHFVVKGATTFLSKATPLEIIFTDTAISFRMKDGQTYTFEPQQIRGTLSIDDVKSDLIQYALPQVIQRFDLLANGLELYINTSDGTYKNQAQLATLLREKLVLDQTREVLWYASLSTARKNYYRFGIVLCLVPGLAALFTGLSPVWSVRLLGIGFIAVIALVFYASFRQVTVKEESKK